MSDKSGDTRQYLVRPHWLWRLYHLAERIHLFFHPFDPKGGFALGTTIRDGVALVSFARLRGDRIVHVICQLPQGVAEMREQAKRFAQIADQLEAFHGDK